MGNLRIPFQPATIFHVYNHGNGGDNIFRTEDNYHYFLKKYSDYINPIAHTFAYCLLPNHFHFMVRMKEEKELLDYFKSIYPDKDPQGFENLGRLISQRFSNFLNAYTKAFNKVFQRRGSLFLDNINRKPVEHLPYYKKLIHYIHYNPVHHGFVNHPEDWPHSSYHAMLTEKQTRLERTLVVQWFGDRDQYIKCHQGPPDMSLFLDLEY
jgi:REP element-mobilizing transposase RayT